MNTEVKPGLLHAHVTDGILAAFYDVYNELGHGFTESVYEAALVIALQQRALQFERQAQVTVRFRGLPIGDFRLDLVVEKCVVVEVKAVGQLLPVHEIQLVNYLKSTGLRVGLLLNFGPRAQFRRKVF